MDHANPHHDDSEDINEWQQIEQQPNPTRLHQPPSLGIWDMVLVNENYLHAHVDQSSSTEDPPTPTPTPTPIHQHHEGSLEETVPATTMDTEDGTSSPSAEGEAEMTAEAPPPSDWRVRVANEGRKLLKLRLEAVRNGVVRAASRVRECAVCVGEFWSVTCVAGAAAAAAAVLVAVVYVRIRRRRRRVGRQQRVDHLVCLLREKDEKISQLLLHIAQLNEVLSSRRKVPVLRISSG